MIGVPGAGSDGLDARPSTPAEVGPGSRIRSVPVLEAVTTDRHVVLYLDGAVHVLNSTAALVWESCEEDVTVATLAREFAASFDVARSEVLADVLGTVRNLVDQGLMVHVDRAPDGTSERMPPVLQPLPVCSGCGEGPRYERHVIVDLGEVSISIGVDAEVADVLVAAIGRRVVHVEIAPADRASYGLVVPSGARNRHPVALARLHRGPDVLLTSRDPLRVLRAVFAQIAIHSSMDGGQLLEGIAVGREGRVVIMPTPANRVAFERRAAALGLGVSDASMVIVGVSPPRVTIGAPDLGVDFVPLEVLATARRSRSEPARQLPWGRYDLAGIVVNGSPNAASVVGELGPRLATMPSGGVRLTPLLSLPDEVLVAQGTRAADIDRLLATSPDPV